VTDPDVRLLDLVGDIFGLLDLDELRDGLLNALPRAITTDYISLNEVGPTPTEVVSVARPPLDERFHASFAELAHQNPLVQKFADSRDARARRFSDVVSREELEATRLYQEVYRPLGIRHQMAFVLSSAPGRFMGVALSRGDPDFSDDERDLLDRARPFLVQAHRNAIAHTALRDSLRATTSSEPMIRALVLEGLTGREAQILSLTTLGASSREAGEQLGISERTVHKHLERAFQKLGVHTRSAAGARAWELTHQIAGDPSRRTLLGP
jgi:DNA-binding CsgD family transcriptional regulator